MSNPKDTGRKSRPRKLSLDSWAVVAALLAALLVRLGAVRHIPW